VAGARSARHALLEHATQVAAVMGHRVVRLVSVSPQAWSGIVAERRSAEPTAPAR
jgi:hypothetical protein